MKVDEKLSGLPKGNDILNGSNTLGNIEELPEEREARQIKSKRILIQEQTELLKAEALNKLATHNLTSIDQLDEAIRKQNEENDTVQLGIDNLNLEREQIKQKDIELTSRTRTLDDIAKSLDKREKALNERESGMDATQKLIDEKLTFYKDPAMQQSMQETLASFKAQYQHIIDLIKFHEPQPNNPKHNGTILYERHKEEKTYTDLLGKLGELKAKVLGSMKFFDNEAK